MAYVLEYSSFLYQRRRRSRRWAAVGAAVLLAIAVPVSFHAANEYRKPTFDELVNGIRNSEKNDPEKKTALPSLQSLADDAFARHETWTKLRKDHEARFPYLSLCWVPCGPTNLLGALCATNREVGISPSFLKISFARGESLATSSDAGRSGGVQMTVKWRERPDLVAATNWIPAVEGASVHFDAGDGGSNAVAELKASFPGAIPVPWSANLDNEVSRLRGLHSALHSVLYRNWSWANMPSCINEKKEADVSKSKRKIYEDTQEVLRYNRALDPGAWHKREVNPKITVKPDDLGKVQRGYRIWARATQGRMPWNRRAVRTLLKDSPLVPSEDYIRNLSRFLSALPAENVLADADDQVLLVTSGLANALDLKRVSPFLKNGAPTSGDDVVRELTPDAGLPGLAEKIATFRLSKATEYGPVGFSEDVSGTCEFFRWRYVYTRAGDGISVETFCRELAAFLAAEYGYVANLIEVTAEDGFVASAKAEGLVPVFVRDDGSTDRETK